MKRLWILLIPLILGMVACSMLIVILIAWSLSSRGNAAPRQDIPTVTPSAPLDIAATVTPTPSITVTPNATASPAPTNTPIRTSGSSGSSASVPTAYVPPPPPVYTVSLPAPYPACSVSPAGAYDVNIRQGPSTTYAITGRLRIASWVQVAQTVGGWYQIAYPGTPVHNSWVSGAVTTLTQPCICGPNCNVPAPPPPPPAVCTGAPLQTTALYSGPSRDYSVVKQVSGGTSFRILARSNAYWYKLDIGAPYWTGWIDGAFISLAAPCPNLPIENPPPPPPPPVQGCSVTAKQASTIYEGPGIAYREIMQIAAGGTYAAVIRSSNGWLKLAITSPETGWINGTQVMLAGKCATLPVQDPPAQTCMATAGQQTDVYSGPGMDYTLVTQIAAGTSVPVAAISDTRWYKFYLQTFAPADGVWIPGSSVTIAGDCRNVPIENPPPPGCTAVTKQDVTMYAGPSTDYDVVGTSPAGTVHPVSARSSTYWYKVTPLHFTPPPDFWIDGSLLEFSASCHILDVEDPPPPPKPPQVCTATANQEAQLYSAPSADSDPLALIQGGERYNVIARSVSGWYRLDHPASPDGGWIDAALIMLDGDCDSVPVQ